MNWRCWFGHRFSRTLGAPFVEDGRLKVRCSACSYISPGVLLPSSTPVERPWTPKAAIVDLTAYRQAQERRTA